MCSFIAEYSRDSFNRFGDDLCELILSYLSISDAFRLQCVNKQFNALIFNKQTELKLISHKPCTYMGHIAVIDELTRRGVDNSVYINNDILHYVLNKCVNINRIAINGSIQLDLTDETINIISNACKHLKKLSISAFLDQISLECWQTIAENSFKNLKSLTLYDFNAFDDNRRMSSAYVAIILSFTPKLKSIHFRDFDGSTVECFQQNRQHLLSSIESVKGYEIRDDKFIRFTDYFKHRLKSLKVDIDTDISIGILKHLAFFERLEYLECEFDDWEDQNCNEVLKQIGLKCTKLKVLVIDSLYAPFYEVFGGGFKSLQKLVIKDRYWNLENIALLKNCVQLKHLVLKSTRNEESDIKDIHLYLPQLKSIDIDYADPKHEINCKTDSDSEEHYNNKRELIKAENATKFMQHLAKLPNLSDLKIGRNGRESSITTANIISFIDNCLSIRRITFDFYAENIDETEIQDYITTINRKIDFNI